MRARERPTAWVSQATVVMCVALTTILASCGGGDGATGITSTVAETSSPTSLTDQESVMSPIVDAALAEAVDAHDIPSVAVGIVVEDEVVWSAGYGDQDALDTVYQIGSIEKTFMVTAIYQLAEEGRIDLSADISDYLPFTVRHPRFPETPITVRMLLTHTSGLSHDLPDNLWFDNDDAFLAFGSDNELWDLSDSPFQSARPSLSEYLESWLAPEGSHADEPGAWSQQPGQWGYSNVALSHLSALLIEEVTGQPFYDYVADQIFDPLGMRDSFVDSKDVAESRIAIPHTRHEGVNQPLLLTGMRASDRIRTTATDMATFLALHMNDGTLDGVDLITAAAASAIREPQVELSGTDFPGLGLRGQGMAWTIWDQNRSGHSGATPGYFGVMMMQETDEGRIGVVILQNVGCSLACDQQWFVDGHTAIRDLLIEEAQRLLAGRN